MTGTLWITGAAGFSGRHLSAHLVTVAHRPRIIGLGRDTTPAIGTPFDEYVSADVRDAHAMQALANRHRPDWVIHLAGRTHSEGAAELWEMNVGALLGLGQGLAAAGCSSTRVLSIGSAAEYEPSATMPLTEASPTLPASPYGRTKLAQTLLAQSFSRSFGVPCCVARPFNLVGPGTSERLVGGRLVSEYVRVRAEGGAMSLRSIDTYRDFVDVRDAVRAYWLLAQHGRDGEVYNVCSGRPVQIASLVALLREIAGYEAEVHPADRAPASPDPGVVFGSSAKLYAETGWQPHLTLRQSLEDMWETRRGTAAPEPVENGA